MEKHEPLRRASVRGMLLRELIAAGVRLAGGDIIAFAKKYIRVSKADWQPPRGWSMEKVSLPGGAHANYMVPKGCIRRDVAILHLHGGGYTLGFLPVFKRFALKLAGLGGQVPVLSLDYRVAPEHLYPAALEDAVDAVAWLGQSKGVPPERIIAAGESCGAGMALALAMRLRDSGHVAELVDEELQRHAVLQGVADCRREAVHQAGDGGALFGHGDEQLAGGNRLRKGRRSGNPHVLRWRICG